MNDSVIVRAYELARERYAEQGVQTDRALEKLSSVAISLPCWQADDGIGLFADANARKAGINLPGRARNAEEIRRDLAKALSLIPGTHRISLNAQYAETAPATRPERISSDQFSGWIEWATRRGIALDFRCNCGGSGDFSLSSLDATIRRSWMEQVERCRRIVAYFQKESGSASHFTLAVRDQGGDSLNRHAHRALLKETLDEIFGVSLSGTGDAPVSMILPLVPTLPDEYAVCSPSFTFGYALNDRATVCMPISTAGGPEADEISVLLQFVDEIGLAIGAGERQYGVPIPGDGLHCILHEVVRSDALGQVHFFLDFTEPRLNRIGALALAVRSLQRALLAALLEPGQKLRAQEKAQNRFAVRAILSENQTLPLGAVWDYFCFTRNVPCADAYIPEIEIYERDILAKRI